MIFVLFCSYKPSALRAGNSGSNHNAIIVKNGNKRATLGFYGHGAEYFNLKTNRVLIRQSTTLTRCRWSRRAKQKKKSCRLLTYMRRYEFLKITFQRTLTVVSFFEVKKFIFRA